MKTMTMVVLAIGLTGCAGMQTEGRKIIDSSGSKPDWVKSAEISFEKDGVVFVKSETSVRGDQRLSGCYDLSKLQARQTLVSEISTEIKSKVHSSEQDLSEHAEVYLGKTVLSDSSGAVQGMRIKQNYFERYRIGDVERIDCFVLGALPKADYERLKNRIINKVVAIDPKIKNALIEDQADLVKRDVSKAEGEE